MSGRGRHSGYMLVYVADTNATRRKFHRSRDCRGLRRGEQTILEIDLNDRGVELPCLMCFPDAPRADSAHRYCYQCDTGKIRPCAHNGGVKVFMTRTHRKGSIYRDKGEVFTQERYVWPEHASKYALV